MELRQQWRKVYPWIPRASLVRQVARIAVSPQRLPPGNFAPVFRLARLDRHALIHRALKYGPVFKGMSGRRLVICVVGLDHCKRLLNDHADCFRPATAPLEPLIPKGFMRQMEGDTHRHYRSALVRALSPTFFDQDREILDRIITDGLKKFASAERAADSAATSYLRTLNTVATNMLIRIFFGVPYRSLSFDALVRSFERMGPDGFVWHYGPEQEAGYSEIVNQLRALLDEAVDGGGEVAPHSVLGMLAKQVGHPDDTLLGNIIYMVEAGRFDMYSLFRWLSRFAANNPASLERIATQPNKFSDAFVWETLRLEQIEGLTRNVERDFVFEGYLIPKGIKLRLCIWESHKSPIWFDDPFEFKLDRFVDRSYPTEQYAPFGLGHHRCPLWSHTIAMCSMFVQNLADSYIVEPIEDGPPVLGKFHWEPPRDFTVRLKGRHAPR